MYFQVKKYYKKQLQLYSQTLSLTLDVWCTPKHISSYSI
jgi:hypothetical protein